MTKFKVRIKGVLSASILDGMKWTILKRTDENIYEEQKIIETDNVSICCLRNKNVFTEVFKLKTTSDSFSNPKSQANKIRSNIK